MKSVFILNAPYGIQSPDLSVQYFLFYWSAPVLPADIFTWLCLPYNYVRKPKVKTHTHTHISFSERSIFLTAVISLDLNLSLSCKESYSETSSSADKNVGRQWIFLFLCSQTS